MDFILQESIINAVKLFTNLGIPEEAPEDYNPVIGIYFSTLDPKHIQKVEKGKIIYIPQSVEECLQILKTWNTSYLLTYEKIDSTFSYVGFLNYHNSLYKRYKVAINDVVRVEESYAFIHDLIVAVLRKKNKILISNQESYKYLKSLIASKKNLEPQQIQ